MSDAKLRKLERLYSDIPSDVNLNKYNLARRKAGLQLLRADGYLTSWAFQISQYAPPVDAIDDDLFSEEEYDYGDRVGYTSNLVRKGLHFTATVTRRRRKLTIKYAAEDVLAEVKLVVNLGLRVGEVPGAPVSRMQYSQQIAEYTSTVTVNTTEAKNDVSDVVMSSKSHTEDNTFVNGEELFEYGAKLAASVFADYLDVFSNTVKRKLSVIFLQRYVSAGVALDPTFENKGGWKKALRQLQGWEELQGYLSVFASSVEDFIEHSIVFDNEGGWPISCKYGSITITPGYCDPIGEELSEGEEPDSNTRGQRRGYAYDVADKMGDLLRDFEEELELKSKEEDPWECEYELEEAYVDEDFPEDVELCFSIPCSRELTPEYLLLILRDYSPI